MNKDSNMSTEITSSDKALDNPPSANVDRSYYTTYYQSEDFDIDDSLRTFFSVLLKRRWLLILISVLTVIVSAFVVEEPTYIYSSTASLQVRDYLPPLGGHLQNQLRQETRKQHYLNTVMELIKTRAIAESVLADEELLKKITSYFEATGALNNFKAPLLPEQFDAPNIDIQQQQLSHLYTTLISHNRIEDTDIVKISATTTDPVLSAEIANAHSKAFINLSHKDRQSSALKVHDFLHDRVEKLKSEANTLEKKVVQFADKNNLFFNAVSADQASHSRHGTMRDDNNFSSVRLTDLYEQLSFTKVDRTRAESLAREYRKQLGSSNDPIVNPNDVAARDTYQDLLELQVEYERWKELARGGAKNIHVRLITKEIRRRKKTLKILEQATLGRLETEAKARKKQQSLIESEINKLKDETLSQRKQLSEFDRLRNQFDSVRKTYQFLLERLEEAKIAIASDSKNISIIDKAIPTTEADNAEQKTYHILIGCFFGPLLGIAAAFILHLFDNTITTTEDLIRQLRIPTLGTIPTFSTIGQIEAQIDKQQVMLDKPEDGDKNNRDQPIDNLDTTNVQTTAIIPADQLHQNKPNHWADTQVMSGDAFGKTTQTETMIFDTETLIVAGAPWSIESEAFRNMRTTISYSAADKPPKTLLLTSGSKGDGKSTVCANLAVSLAQNSNRVLLIDGDLRRPSMYKMFNIRRTTPGLADYLAGQRDCSEIMLANIIENFTLIAAGTPPPNPTELLGSRRMAELLEMMETEYDYILIDSPPVLGIADARVLSSVVEGVILIARSGKTTRPVVSKAASELNQIGAKILGSVLNGVDISSYSGYDPDSMYYYVEPEI